MNSKIASKLSVVLTMVALAACSGAPGLEPDPAASEGAISGTRSACPADALEGLEPTTASETAAYFKMYDLHQRRVADLDEREYARRWSWAEVQVPSGEPDQPDLSIYREAFRSTSTPSSALEYFRMGYVVRRTDKPNTQCALHWSMPDGKTSYVFSSSTPGIYLDEENTKIYKASAIKDPNAFLSWVRDHGARFCAGANDEAAFQAIRKRMTKLDATLLGQQAKPNEPPDTAVIRDAAREALGKAHGSPCPGK
jgi:hypothetical protein